MKHNDGGPAFPLNERTGDGVHYHSHAGMTLRDYFAAKAMGNYFARNRNRELTESPEDIAKASYQIADAMLKARTR